LEVVGSETGVSVGGDACLSPSLASALSSLPASSVLAKVEPVSSPPAALGPLHLPPSACSRFASASDLQVSPRLPVSSPSSPSASRLASPARARRGLAPETGGSRSLGSSLEPGGDSAPCCCPHSRSATRCCCYEISPPFFFTTTSASPFSSSFQPFMFPSQGSLLPLSLHSSSPQLCEHAPCLDALQTQQCRRPQPRRRRGRRRWKVLPHASPPLLEEVETHQQIRQPAGAGALHRHVESLQLYACGGSSARQGGTEAPGEAAHAQRRPTSEVTVGEETPTQRGAETFLARSTARTARPGAGARPLQRRHGRVPSQQSPPSPPLSRSQVKRQTVCFLPHGLSSSPALLYSCPSAPAHRLRRKR
ncbi:hypothetical protein TGPRC2_263610D, partial [Toxoplasma gondii TgCatPRC2]